MTFLHPKSFPDEYCIQFLLRFDRFLNHVYLPIFFQGKSYSAQFDGQQIVTEGDDYINNSTHYRIKYGDKHNENTTKKSEYVHLRLAGIRKKISDNGHKNAKR